MEGEQLENKVRDEEVIESTAYVRAGLSGQGLCVWYKSPSLVDNTDTFDMCHNVCDGYGSGCNYAMYVTKETEQIFNDLSRGNYD